MPKLVCPECKKEMANNATKCAGCNYDFLTDDCPSCERTVSLSDDMCKHCGYNLSGKGPPPPPPKPKPAPAAPEKPKPKRTKLRESVAMPVRTGRHRGTIHVPALGRMGREPIEFPELHFNSGEPTDEAILEWARNLRLAWDEKVNDGYWLSNHAVGCLASHEKCLEQHVPRILELLGGDDWK